jgi:zinc protease
MYDDAPDAYIFYRTMELGFTKHNYRRPIAGYEKVVRRIKRDQLLEFYHTYYRPSNAVLVVVGDVDTGAALEEIAKTYGKWEDKPADIYEPPPEPPQEAFRFKEFRGSIDHAYVGIGFHIPDIHDKDYPALEMLSSLLSSGKSSRFYRNLREAKQLVTTANSQVLAEKWPGFFEIQASMPVEKWEEAAGAILDELQRFKSEPVSEEELAKARSQLEKSMYAELETMEGQASNLGYYEVMGDYRMAEEHRKAIRAVTPAQIMEVAAKYFRLANCSMVAYLPRDWEKSYDPAGMKDEASKHLLDAGPGETAAAAPSSPAVKPASSPGDAAKSSASAGPPKLFELENGVRVIVKRRPMVPLVSMVTLFGGGARLEEPGKAGLSILTFRSLVKGTKSYDAGTIAEKVEGLGGNIESLSSFDVAGVYTNILSENVEKVLPVYKQVIREPTFPEQEVRKEQDKLLEELAKRHDTPTLLGIDTLFADLFGKHPYSKPFLGDEEELKALSRDDCVAFYRNLLVPGNIVVAFIGDIEEGEARKFATEIFGDLEAGEVPKPTVAAPDRPARTGLHELRKEDVKQSMALVGFLAPPMMTGEAWSLEVLNGLLTGLGGRLFVELRDKRSLGYMAGSAFIPLKERSLFMGYANPTEEGVDEAFKVIIDELKKVTKEKVSDDEIERSKEWLIGTRIMQLQRNFSQAMAYASYEALGFGYQVVDEMPEMIQQVTKEDIKAAAAAVFDEKRAVLVKLVPEEKEKKDEK